MRHTVVTGTHISQVLTYKGNHLSQVPTYRGTNLSQLPAYHRYPLTTGTHLSQVPNYQGTHLSQVPTYHRYPIIKVPSYHRYTLTTGTHLSQVPNYYRYPLITGIHLSRYPLKPPLGTPLIYPKLLICFLLHVFSFLMSSFRYSSPSSFTLTPLTWRIWWAPNNTSTWQMGFDWAFKAQSTVQITLRCAIPVVLVQ